MPSPALKYELLATCPQTGARRGRVHTRHGVIDTPAFMPVGTQGTVKGLLPSMLEESGAQCILGNTYHLLLRPGPDTVAALGDLHGMMGWDGPILTDSGGFQVFSLADMNKIDDEGVTFKSHIDGSMIRLTPERSMEVQNKLGADIIMAFDQCPPGNAPIATHRIAMDRTLAWIERCKQAHARPEDQSLFGIVQGGPFPEMRAECAKRMAELDLPGYALGGMAVGEGFEAMKRTLKVCTPMLPAEKPRYLMGVGYPRDIVTAVASGVDMFDCVIPTRVGRNALVFTPQGAIRLKNNKFTRDAGPIEEGCDCYACRRFTRGALRHYFFASEMLGPMLAALHNTRFYQRLMADIRSAITAGTFGDFLAGDPRCLLAGKGDGALLRAGDVTASPGHGAGAEVIEGV